MFTYFQNLSHAECVSNLIKRPVVSSDIKCPMYHSKFSCKVRQETYCSKTGAYRTMGLPHVPKYTPQEYLKKQSRCPKIAIPKAKAKGKTEAKSEIKEGGGCDGDGFHNNNLVNCEEITQENCDADETEKDAQVENCAGSLMMENGGGDGDCLRIESPNSKSQEKVCINQQQESKPKDFIRENAIRAICRPPKLFQNSSRMDTPKGHRERFLERYVCKNDFGCVPAYLMERKKELLEQDYAEKYKKDQAHLEEMEKCHRIPDQERAELICGLKEAWDATFSEFQSLPLKVTDGKCKRKKELEDKLKDLETDIQFMMRHNHIFVAECANNSEYLN